MLYSGAKGTMTPNRNVRARDAGLCGLSGTARVSADIRVRPHYGLAAQGEKPRNARFY